jgi:hypothetical protein
MKKSTLCGACALASLTLSVGPVFADEATNLHADSHAPAGVMFDHVHGKGGVMVGLTFMHDDYGGTNRSGTSDITDSAMVAAGYSARTTAMKMDMAMLHVMWAPSDRVTLMVMPSWTRMKMEMVGLTPAAGVPAHSHGGHSLDPGQTASHVVSGIGDTVAAALISIARSPAMSAHAALAVSIPTGSVSRRDEDGVFVHYGMQPGSGTWDILPSLTVRGKAGKLGWGAQTAYVFRAEKINRSGFRFGDRLTVTGWADADLSPAISLSGRLAYSYEGDVKGHYNASHNHAAPPDRQANYGGQRIEAGLGANAVLVTKWRLGGEVTVPVYQRLNGIQAPKRFGLNLALSRSF